LGFERGEKGRRPERAADALGTPQWSVGGLRPSSVQKSLAARQAASAADCATKEA